jgi:hypothetical protein
LPAVCRVLYARTWDARHGSFDRIRTEISGGAWYKMMKIQRYPATVVVLGVLAGLSVGVCAVALTGCRGKDHQDTVVASVASPGHTSRATILVRQGITDGKVDTRPTTYVVVDKDTGKSAYANGEDFQDSQVAMKATQCGPLELRWTDDRSLKVICQNCGLALSAVSLHAGAVGAVRVEYDGFPERSSWDPGPGGS